MRIPGYRGSAARAALLSHLFVFLLIVVPAAAAASEPDPAAGPATAASPEAPSTVPAANNLQGNEGVRVQTMCTNCNSANIDLGGLGGELLPIDFDGWDVIGGMMTIYTLNVMPPGLVGHISVSKGPGDFTAPPEAIGGSIHITSTPPALRKPVVATGETGSFGWASGTANGTWRRGGFAATGLYVRSHSDTIDANDDGFPESGRLSRNYGALGLSYGFANGIRLSGEAAAIREDDPDGHGAFSTGVSLAEGRTVFLEESAFVDLDAQRVGLDIPVGRRGTLTLRALRSVRDHNIVDQAFVAPDIIERPSYDIEDRNFAADLAYEQVLTDRLALLAGVTKRREVLEVTNFLSVGPSLRNQTDVFDTVGGDAGIQADLSAAWHLRAGLRYDELSTEHAQNAIDPDNPFVALPDKDVRTKSWSRVSPRGSVTWKPAKAWTFTGSVGRGARAARPVFEEVCCGQQYQSNIELELEDSLSGAIEAAWQPSPRFRIGAYTHRTTFRDHIVRMVGYSFGGIQTYAQANVPRARYTGLTLTSRIQLPEKLTVDLACSWLDAVNSSGRRVPMTLYPFDNTPHEYLIPMTDIPYRVRRGGSAAILWTSGQERIEATLQAQFQGPTSIQHWNIFPIAVPIPPFDGYPLCRSTTTGQNSLVCDDTQVTPSFWIVNARATFHPKPWIAIHAGVDNIGDYVQDDLSDPTNDNNWGPIRGRYMYAGVTVTP